jgi:hypothetical protein
VLDKASRAAVAYVASTPARKQSKQQRRSSAGIGRELADTLPGLAVEWNVEAEYSWVWNDNQVGAANNDPELLTRLLQQSRYLSDESDYRAEGKKDVPVEVLHSAYKKFLGRNNPSPVSITGKGGKGKGKGKSNMPGGNQKAKWPPPKTEETNSDLLMLPHPDIVNRDDETYILHGPAHLKVRVTKEKWNKLRLNTKSMSPEYFPSSYLGPVPTVVLETGDASTASFPRSTINGTLEDFQTLLLAPVISKNNRIPQDTYRALSLDSASGATQHTDKATAPKRILAFLQLCAQFIPCEHEDYDEAVRDLDSEVESDVRKARILLEVIQEQNLPAIVKALNGAVSIGFSYGTVRPTTRARELPHKGL